MVNNVHACNGGIPLVEVVSAESVRTTRGRCFST